MVMSKVVGNISEISSYLNISEGYFRKYCGCFLRELRRYTNFIVERDELKVGFQFYIGDPLKYERLEEFMDDLIPVGTVIKEEDYFEKTPIYIADEINADSSGDFDDFDEDLLEFSIKFILYHIFSFVEKDNKLYRRVR